MLKSVLFRYILILIFLIAHQSTLLHIHKPDNTSSSCHTCKVSKHLKFHTKEINFTLIEQNLISQPVQNCEVQIKKSVYKFVCVVEYHSIDWIVSDDKEIPKPPLGFFATAPPKLFS